MNVIPDGIERTITDTTLVMKSHLDTIDVELSCAVPASIALETVTTQISLVGDIQGDSLTNLGNLLAQPSECGEQNLARFATTIFIYDYMRLTGQLSDEIHRKIMDYIEGRSDLQGGMQKHMTLRMPDGSYRFFKKKVNPSTFLTAFTIKVFRKAQTFMQIDQNLIDTAFAWLLTRQEADGGFYENLDDLYNTHHGGLKDKTALAAYIAIIFSQVLKEARNPQYETALNNAINYIIRTADDENAYQLAITCYALFLTDHPIFQSKYDKLISMARQTGDLMYWEVTAGSVLNVETAANALLFISKINYVQSVKIAKYIVSKKNANGSWGTTTDTVTAIESLTAFSDLTRGYNGGLDVMVWPKPNGNVFTLEIDANNLLKLHTFALEPQVRRVTVMVEGPAAGQVTVSFTCRYFEKFEQFAPRFKVDFGILENCRTPLKMQVCVSFIEKPGDTRSNMVLVKMNMPSGYIFDPATPLSPLIQVKS